MHSCHPILTAVLVPMIGLQPAVLVSNEGQLDSCIYPDEYRSHGGLHFILLFICIPIFLWDAMSSDCLTSKFALLPSCRFCHVVLLPADAPIAVACRLSVRQVTNAPAFASPCLQNMWCKTNLPHSVSFLFLGFFIFNSLFVSMICIEGESFIYRILQVYACHYGR